MSDLLNVALVHCSLTHGDLAGNQALLLELGRKAAGLGADIIVNTEMGLSGYGFDSRAEIAPLAQTLESPVVRSFGELSAACGVYLALGLANRDPESDIYYNAAILFGPDGRPQAMHRKITAESKWACPGEPRQNDIAVTPWGAVGLLICSETYFSLIPRAMALKGVDLLLTPANWPPSGLDPANLWRARAIENGMYLAACNRAGQDKRMNMDKARSHLFDPQGNDLLRPVDSEPRILMAQLPLRGGRLDATDQRRARLNTRKPGSYHYIYSQLNRIKEPGPYLGLPEPGLMDVHTLGLDRNQKSADLVARLAALPDAPNRLAVLPAAAGRLLGPSEMAEAARRLGAHLVCHAARQEGVMLFSPDQEPRTWVVAAGGPTEPPVVDLGPARVGLCIATDFLHPELALALAKRGCDVAAVSGAELASAELHVLSMRNLERLTVALAHDNGCLISSPPEGHQRGALLETQGAGACHLALDTSLGRHKTYEERLDYQLLLDQNA
ncbi:Nitrilase/cyanide hydratase and apolipoprotein N-acyltransferase [Desulfarculus baarsii DSM 2075]|uniref:Nitrilase/cyanide hydratase and apolipoprotein N-acyltransferase n=1 Tax=Desulfarculus baarsii (strain ATCC 33931 / DSM 2075 / LMG 7858 / VKM B-1802 / 2st14) TaxID=644282 RepID=E1QJY6_DESB2|nr:nitrilase-related carbon-nitrogen hydrolase [Desulfarculus baarsii]ADK85879.1 Nitrilase/cyanide hydratase and apolipoprotein N-acyltransferase [Desulfarculus baarsii DSM 2075]